jgi:NO-binding membrane sensor protein with MHYT domain
MQRVYACLTEQHDLRLVFLAGLICIAACLISMKLFIHANGAEKGQPLPWLFVAATVFGAGVWATHFIAEVAYEPGVPIGYDAGLTAISLVAAIGAAWLAMFVAHRYAAPALAGAMIGAAIAAMHYIGMAALRAPAQLHWDAAYVLASIAIAVTFAAAAMRVSSWGPALWARLMAVGLLVLAIVGLHFTAMAAVTLVPDPLIAVPGHAIGQNALATAIATVMGFIAGLALLGVMVYKHFALRAAQEAERLRRGEDRLARAQRTAHTGSIEQDLRTGAIEWSGETYRIFGLDPNLPAPVGEAFLALFHPDDRAAYETQGPAHQAAAAGQLHDMPRVDLRFRIVQLGGAVRRVHHESELVLDQHGEAVRWIGTYRDVTEAYEAEESFKLVFEDNPVPMWLFDPKTLRFMAVNDAATAHYGYDRESFLKLTLLDIVPQRDRDAIEQAIRNRPGAGGSYMSRQMGRKSTSSLFGATPSFATGPRSLWRSWM